MTGFGKAEVVFGDKKISAEVRSLNSKQLDLSVKLPLLYRSQDYEIRTMAAKALQRGKADIYVNYEVTSGEGAVAINRELFNSYYAQLREIGEGNGMKCSGEMMDASIMQSILRMPDVVVHEMDSVPEEEIAALKKVVADALANADNFRVVEGKVLMADLLARVDLIENAIDEVTPFEESRIEAIKKRIRESIDGLGLQTDPNRLEQEMIFYVEKLDVTEEKVRLRNHCNYFREVAGSEESPGKKLGFIAQEMGREINTLGSKANNSDIQRIVVGMKDELEKIKEQLLNIL